MDEYFRKALIFKIKSSFGMKDLNGDRCFRMGKIVHAYGDLHVFFKH